MSFWGFILTFIFATQANGADTWTLSNKLNSDTRDFESLSNVLKRPQSSTLEGFLIEWKKTRPEFFSNYVSAYRSRSLQQADRLNPRIILFNKNADMVLSFNGHPKYRGYKQIEMLRFNHSNEAFEFYELSFEKEQSPSLSLPNPKKCLECHQSSNRDNIDPRPNWEPYNTWLGFYGSLDDDTELFKSSFPRSKLFVAETDSILLSDFDNENAWYEEFLKTLSTHPRYSLLDPIQNENYLDERTLNGDLTNRLGVLNLRRVARLMKAQVAIYEKVKWTIWGFANCGQSFYISQDVYKWLLEKTPRKELVRQDPLPPQPLTHCSPNAEFCFKPKLQTTPPYPVVTAAEAINLMFEPFGVDTEDWSMDFKSNARFAFQERFGFTNDPRPPFAAAVTRVFGEDPDFANTTCKDVEARSLKNFGSLKSAQEIYKSLIAQAPQKTSNKPLLERCISCHVTNQMAFGGPPPIPFSDPIELKKNLKISGYKRGTLMEEILFRTGPFAGQEEQMPPRGIPTIKEREDLLFYLKSLQ